MRHCGPVEVDEDELRKGSICQYCGVLMIEADGRVYHTPTRGWMCDSCYLGDQKPHCMPRPYKKR